MEKITAEISRVGLDQVESGWSEGEVKRISRESKKHFPSPGVKNSKTPGWDSGSSVWLQKPGEGPSPGGGTRGQLTRGIEDILGTLDFILRVKGSSQRVVRGGTVSSFAA